MVILKAGGKVVCLSVSLCGISMKRAVTWVHTFYVELWSTNVGTNFF